MNNPLVSVVIPAYNAQPFVAETIDSVLAQTYQNFEIIVIDDGSSDSTLEILNQYSKSYSKVKVLTHQDNQNLGVSKSRQLGVQYAQGSYIAFLDSDDIFLPEKLQIQVDTFSRFEDIILCHTGVKVSSTVKKCPNFSSHFSISSEVHSYYHQEKSYFLKTNHICNSTTFVKTSVLKEVSFSSYQIFQYEDWLLWILLSTKGKFLFLPQQLIKYRYHPASATSSIVSQPIKNLYSKIELLLSLITKLDEKKMRSLIISELRDVLIELTKVYAESSKSGDKFELIYEFILDLFNNNAESPDFSQNVILKVAPKILELESQISAMQNSKVWRLRNKLISLRKKLFESSQ